MRTPILLLSILSASLAMAEERVPSGGSPPLPEKTPAQSIQDNSFLIEEAYNQEAGVVQHIFNLSLGVDKRHGADEREWLFSFTQEWPLWSQAHQFSYTIPYSWLK